MHWKKGKIRGVHVLAMVAAMTVLGSGYAWYYHFAPAARLSRACSGMLPVRDTLAMTGTTARFGGRDLKLSSGHFDVSDDVSEPKGLAVGCQANNVEITIETTAGSYHPFGTYVFQQEDKVLPIPLGRGWSGFVAADNEDTLGVSVLLNCSNWKPRQGSGILVTANASGVDNASAPERARLARIATQTAKNAAEKTGCDATTGSAVTHVDSESTTARKSADQADGTCAGTSSQSSIRETAARTSPVEHCLLGNNLRLTATYGPFASVIKEESLYTGFDKPSGVRAYITWGTATCRGAQATALYAASPATGSGRRFNSQPLTARELEDLKQFAERSAARHRCSSPVLPQSAK